MYPPRPHGDALGKCGTQWKLVGHAGPTLGSIPPPNNEPKSRLGTSFGLTDEGIGVVFPLSAGACGRLMFFSSFA